MTDAPEQPKSSGAKQWLLAALAVVGSLVLLVVVVSLIRLIVHYSDDGSRNTDPYIKEKMALIPERGESEVIEVERGGFLTGPQQSRAIGSTADSAEVCWAMELTANFSDGVFGCASSEQPGADTVRTEVLPVGEAAEDPELAEALDLTKYKSVVVITASLETH